MRYYWTNFLLPALFCIALLLVSHSTFSQSTLICHQILCLLHFFLLSGLLSIFSLVNHNAFITFMFSLFYTFEIARHRILQVLRWKRYICWHFWVCIYVWVHLICCNLRHFQVLWDEDSKKHCIFFCFTYLARPFWIFWLWNVTLLYLWKSAFYIVHVLILQLFCWHASWAFVICLIFPLLKLLFKIF